MTVDLSRAVRRRGFRPRGGLIHMAHVGPCGPTGGASRGGMRGCGRFGGALTGSRLFFGNSAMAEWDFRHASCQFNYQDGTGEQFVDWTMEAAGVGAWAVVSGAILTKEAGDLSGTGGSLVLRVGAGMGDAFSAARQTVLTIGARYRVVGFARGDGTNGLPKISDGVAFVWTGTTSNDTQTISADFTAQGTTCNLSTGGNVGTVDYSEWDDVSIIELPGYALVPNRIEPGLRDLSQPVAASMPWRNPTGYNGGLAAQWDRTALLDMISHAVGSDVFGRRPQDSPLTVAMIGRITDLTSGDWLLGAGRASSATPHHGIQNLSGNYRINKKEDSGVSSANTDGAIDTNRHTLIWTNTGTAESLYIDKVVTAIDSSAADRGLTTLDQFVLGAKVGGGSISSRISAMFVEVWIAREAFGPDVVTNVHNYLVAKHGGI